MNERLQLACFTPLPPLRTGIADYSAALLPHLAKHVAVDVFVDTPEQVDPLYRQQYLVRPIAEFLTRSELRWQYDACLYHMGNQSRYHAQIYEAQLRRPGIAVLHEVGLFGFYANYSAPSGGSAFFIREMGYAYGPRGTQAARAIAYDGCAYQAHDYPLFHRIATLSRGIVVHTQAALRQILYEVPRARVVCIPLAARVPTKTPEVKPDWLAQLPPGAVVLASFGFFAPSKRIDVILQAVARLRSDFPNLRYVIVGEAVDHYDLAPLIQRLDLANTVHITGFVGASTFESYLQMIDIGINLRTGPSGGEMSAGVTRLLAAGRPTIVSEVDGFAELPDNCVVKIKQDHHEIEQLVAVLRQLILDPAARAAYGENARRYAQSELSFTHVAQSYAEFIRECSDATSKRP